ncbi:ABC transporter substrate-binding protein [Treponema sp.]
MSNSTARAGRLFVGFAIIILILLSSCGKKPVVLGFLGGVSGRFSDLGISGRNGAQLAIELRNASGGIEGRQVQLALADDQQEPDAAIRAFKKLEEAGAVAIIGPMTSDMALAVKPFADKSKLLLISPTASSPALSDLDDWFIRVNPVDVSEGRDLARYIQAEGALSLFIYYDLNNKNFSEGTEKTLRNALEGSGISIVSLPFNSKESSNYSAFIQNSLEKQGTPDAVVVVASSVDAALICQLLRKDGFKGSLYGTGWSMTDDFIRLSGSAGEGLIFSHYFDRNSASPRWREFSEQYKGRFGVEPDFIAGLGANAAIVAMEGLLAQRPGTTLKDTIISMRNFEGLQGSLSFDSYGECDLERFKFRIKDGQLVVDE